ncbi:alpha/beta family hydrolase [Actinomycetota bacterium]
MKPSVVEIETPQGPARAHVFRPPRAIGSLILGHGAGGGIDAPDLALLARELPDDGWAVVLVEQPWRVAGKKVATPPKTLDEAWIPVVAALTSGDDALPEPIVVGGRSAGARVACRTAEQVGAAAALALSFPLHPPGKPEKSRAEELQAPIDAGLPVHVVQGEKDPFGGPDEIAEAVPDTAYLDGVAGAHSFSKDPQDVLEAVRLFLAELTWAT